MVEIVDTSLAYDRDRKFPRYSEADLPESWLLDVFTSVLERHTVPYAGRYRELVTARRGESLSSTTVPGLILSVDEIVHEGE